MGALGLFPRGCDLTRSQESLCTSLVHVGHRMLVELFVAGRGPMALVLEDISVVPAQSAR